ncbi:MAG: glycosyltransferase [Cyclobacteriaceae bacterium]
MSSNISGNNSKKVLIVTYYWPPSGGGGVQRWLKFSKFLPAFGWQPIIYTPENPAFDVHDASLISDIQDEAIILKRKIWEPFGIYQKLRLGNKKNDLKQGVVNDKNNQSFLNSIVIWIRGNLFFPDPRKFWVGPSVAYLEAYIRENGIEFIITTGPPHSMHLIGLKLKERFGTRLKWLVDFRDPWSQWDILKELKTSSFIMSKHKRLERKVLKRADKVLTVSKSLANALSKLGDRKVEVITNGIDPEDLKNKGIKRDKKFVISHIGLMNELRNPEKLWLALNELCQEDEQFENDLEIFLAGAVSAFILEKLKVDKNLREKVKYVKYLPHDKVFKQYSRSSILLLLVNTTSNAKWILPGKAFEYIAMNRPILTLGQQDIDLQELMTETGHASFYAYTDKLSIKKFISEKYDEFKKESYEDYGSKSGKYDRKNLTKRLSEILNQAGKDQ